MSAGPGFLGSVLGRAAGGARQQPQRALRAVVVALTLVVAAVFPVIERSNVTGMGLATEALTYGLVAVTLNLLMGFGGQISIGHGGLLAVGAYTSAIIATRYHLPFIVTILAAGVATGIVGFLLGLPAGRLRSHYLAVATLGFGVAVPQIALNLGSLTGGFSGLIMPPQTLGSISLSSPVPLYYLALIVLLIAMAAVSSLLASPTGRRFMAIRDSEDTAPAMGINVRMTKLVLFSLSSFFCGLAGYVFALNNSIVEPNSFSFSLSLFFFAAVVVGGLASTWGPVIGAAVLVVIQQESVSLGGLSEAILGAAVVLVLVALPGGLAALPARIHRTLRRPENEPAPATAGLGSVVTGAPAGSGGEG